MEPIFADVTRLQVRRLSLSASQKDAARRGRGGEKIYVPDEDADPEIIEGQLKMFTLQRTARGQLGNMPTADGVFIYKTPADDALVLKHGDWIVGEEVRPGVFAKRNLEVDDDVTKGHLTGGAVLHHAILKRRDERQTGR